ncbi:MAG TPA: hypothetical protein VLQ67_08515 [Arachnia sp.]|nr:hypothetical protein [Arachnia sp.]
MTTSPEPEALAAVYPRLAEALHEVRVGVPPSRDAAFDTLRRLLAVHVNTERLGQPHDPFAGTWNGKAARSQRAIAASVAFLEMVRRDSLDFVIEAGLLEEILADYLAPGPAAAPDAQGRGE